LINYLTHVSIIFRAFNNKEWRV